MKKNRRYTNTFSGHKNTIKKLINNPNCFDELIKDFEEMDKVRLPNGKLPDWFIEKHKD